MIPEKRSGMFVSFGGTVTHFSPSRISTVLALSFLMVFPPGMLQKLHAQSASTRPIRRPEATLAIPAAAPLPAVRQAADFSMRVIRGAGAVNNILERTAVEPIVEIRAANGSPLPGVAVTFFLPETGPGATFAGGGTILGTVTDAAGRATATGLTPNNIEGSFDIDVEATYEQRTIRTTVRQTNAPTGVVESGGVSSTALVIIGLVGGIAAGVGFAVAGRGDSGGGGATTPPPTNPPIRVTPGDPTVGSPR